MTRIILKEGCIPIKTKQKAQIPYRIELRQAKLKHQNCVRKDNAKPSGRETNGVNGVNTQSWQQAGGCSSVYLVKVIRGRAVIYNLFPKFHVRYEGFSFYVPKMSDQGADTDLIYVFCWLNVTLLLHLIWRLSVYTSFCQICWSRVLVLLYMCYLVVS